MGYMHITADEYSDFELADGRQIGKVRRTDLVRELQRMRVPGVDEKMAKSQLLRVYGAYVKGIAAELGRDPGKQLSQEAMRSAVAFASDRAAP